MALTQDQITAQNFKRFFEGIRPYLNGAAHSGFTPVGTVISVMGKTAPLNYLVCDGTVYNIADYSELANYFAGQFEAANFFGGDGVTTFAVPDLRGEFLRGTGTNSHTNQGSGANVGEHQDGTLHPAIGVTDAQEKNIYQFANPNYLDPTLAGTTGLVKDPDITHDSLYDIVVTGNHNTRTTEGRGPYTSRPTNTSVLYCIATKNIFMDAGMNYSTEEQVVGTWIGKPLYQKSWTGLSVAVTTETANWQVFSGVNVPNGRLVSAIFLSNDSKISVTPQECWLRDTTGNLETLYWPESRTISDVTLRYTKNTD